MNMEQNHCGEPHDFSIREDGSRGSAIVPVTLSRRMRMHK